MRTRYSRPAQRRSNKFNAARAEAPNFPELAGYSFASKLERDRAVELVILQRAGTIDDLRFQPTVHLTRARLQYTPDFSYCTEHGELIYEETKGLDTYPWKTYRRLWKHYGPATLLVYRRDRGGRIKMTEEIIPIGDFN